MNKNQEISVRSKPNGNTNNNNNFVLSTPRSKSDLNRKILKKDQRLSSLVTSTVMCAQTTNKCITSEKTSSVNSTWVNNTSLNKSSVNNTPNSQINSTGSQTTPPTDNQSVTDHHKNNNSFTLPKRKNSRGLVQPSTGLPFERAVTDLSVIFKSQKKLKNPTNSNNSTNSTNSSENSSKFSLLSNRQKYSSLSSQSLNSLNRHKPRQEWKQHKSQSKIPRPDF